MVRILYLTQGLGVGGTERQLLHLVQSLDRAQYKPAVAAFSARGGLRPLFEAAGVELIDLGIEQPLLRWRNINPLRRFYRTLRARHYDILHTWLYHANVVGAALGRFAGIRHVIVSERNLGYFQRPIHRWVGRLTYTRAACVTTNARSIADVLLKNKMARPDRLVVVPNGIAMPATQPSVDDVKRARQKFGMPASGPVIAAVGRLAPVKGYAYLLEAVPVVRAKFPRATFVFAGDGPSMPSLQSRAQVLGVDSHVRFAGHVDDVPALLSAADIFVLPSVSEGLSNALMEAMAAAKPVVATAVGGNCELIEHGRSGLLVPVGDSGALADAIVTLLNDPVPAAKLGRTARTKVEPYSIERMTRRFAELYEQLLKADRA